MEGKVTSEYCRPRSAGVAEPRAPGGALVAITAWTPDHNPAYVPHTRARITGIFQRPRLRLTSVTAPSSTRSSPATSTATPAAVSTKAPADEALPSLASRDRAMPGSRGRCDEAEGEGRDPAFEEPRPRDPQRGGGGEGQEGAGAHAAPARRTVDRDDDGQAKPGDDHRDLGQYGIDTSPRRRSAG